jgi:hypothetical protein
MSDHSSVPPSGLGRAVKCSAALVPNASNNTPNEAALEGSTAHWSNDERLKGIDVKVGDICPETNLPVDQDMLIYGDLYIDYVRKLGGEVGSEYRVSIPQIHKLCWGTLDYYAYYKTLTIVDYKYGFITVNPADSIPLVAYARGKANDLNLDSNTQVKLVIVQPRPWHEAGRIREYHTTLYDIDKQIEIIHNAVKEGLSQNRTARTGGQCMYCVKAARCEALTLATYNAVDIARRDYDVIDFGNKQLSICLDNLEKAEALIKIRKDALAEKAKDSLLRGDRVPGYSIRSTYSSKKWTKPDDEIIMAGELLGVTLSKETLITPAQAKKLNVPSDIIDKLSISVQTGTKLTRSDDNLAKLIFSKKAE